RDLREFYLPPRLNRQEVDINGLLREIYELSLNQCKKKNIMLEVDTDEGETRALADRDRIKQVILNLVNNAIDAMENGGKLSLQSRRSGGKVLVTVRDTGCGIPGPEQGKVFSPFFTSKEHGTGLGLSISKRIIEEHRGSSLTMESEEGKGNPRIKKEEIHDTHGGCGGNLQCRIDGLECQGLSRLFHLPGDHI
ncbi:MAG: hypothetical protein JRJ03_20065, partial [Deltaproteobacteria bacterium]|nr:hypothetical protein [Deltaproteobacteria bacterium]